MKRKTLLITVLACMLVAAVSIGGTVAWLTSRDSATNKFTIGYVDIQINEPGWTEAAKDIAPDGTVAKAPSVQNVGKNPCIIRAKYEISPSSMAPYLQIVGLPGTGWSAAPDSNGYYYYLSVVAPTASTTALFTGVKLLDTYTETDATVTFDIPVSAEAIQSENMGLGATFDVAAAQAVFANYTP